MSECQECKLEERTAKLERIAENQEVRIKDLEARDVKSSQERKEFYSRFDRLTLDNQKHEMKIENIFEKLDSIDGKTDEIDRKVDEINGKPAKDADKFKSAIISAIGSAVGAGIIVLILYALLQSI